LRLRACSREEVTHRIRVVALEHVSHVDRHSTTRRQLLALHRQELARNDFVGEMQFLARAELPALAVANQHARPDHGVKNDVVLPHEVRVRRLRVLPPRAPGLGVATVVGPLDRRGQVADHGIEPDVDALRLRRIPLHRHRDSPVDVTCHCAGLQIVDEGKRKVADVRAPARFRLDPGPQPVGELRQIEKEVLRLTKRRCRAVDDRARVDEVGRIELVAAVVALVAAGLGVAANRTCAFDVPVGQRVSR